MISDHKHRTYTDAISTPDAAELAEEQSLAVRYCDLLIRRNRINEPPLNQCSFELVAGEVVHKNKMRCRDKDLKVSFFRFGDVRMNTLVIILAH